MPRPIYILVHTLAAGAFMFYLQTLVLHATFETRLASAIAFGLGGAGLAWHQSNR